MAHIGKIILGKIQLDEITLGKIILGEEADDDNTAIYDSGNYITFESGNRLIW